MYSPTQAYTMAQQRKKIYLQCRRPRRGSFDPWVRKIPWRRAPQYSWWENPMDRGAWQATIHRFAKSQTQPIQLSSSSSLLLLLLYSEWNHESLLWFIRYTGAAASFILASMTPLWSHFLSYFLFSAPFWPFCCFLNLGNVV